MDDELHLAGGNVSGEVVRVGSTVRKAWTDASPSVRAFMDAVRDQGVDVPAPLGRDEQGRIGGRNEMDARIVHGPDDLADPVELGERQLSATDEGIEFQRVRARVVMCRSRAATGRPTRRTSRGSGKGARRASSG
ncbi:hypothetical protein [Agromyces sp. ZXT2-6]|uniref:hypothetical protein n=1 Tax=Agromyces sp. ZXT2-6 TaxID=3461153 RepID=UPI0040550E06